MDLTDPTFDVGFVFTPSLPMRSKSNHRRAPGSQQWASFRAFEDAVAYDARSHLPADWPDAESDRPLAERPVVGLVIVASTTIDATNLSKSVADALEGVCYANDASVRLTAALSIRSAKPHAAIGLCALRAPVELDVATGALHRLVDLTVEHFHRTAPERAGDGG